MRRDQGGEIAPRDSRPWVRLGGVSSRLTQGVAGPEPRALRNAMRAARRAWSLTRSGASGPNSGEEADLGDRRPVAKPRPNHFRTPTSAMVGVLIDGPGVPFLRPPQKESLVTPPPRPR